MAIVFPVEVDQFISAAARLSPHDIDQVNEIRMRLFREHGQLPTPKLSAAAFSKLDGRVRAELRARGPQFWAYRVGAISGAIGATFKAASAIWKPEQLTVEDYRLTVEPFTQIGLVTPPHPDALATDPH